MKFIPRSRNRGRRSKYPHEAGPRLDILNAGRFQGALMRRPRPSAGALTLSRVLSSPGLVANTRGLGGLVGGSLVGMVNKYLMLDRPNLFSSYKEGDAV